MHNSKPGPDGKRMHAHPTDTATGPGTAQGAAHLASLTMPTRLGTTPCGFDLAPFRYVKDLLKPGELHYVLWENLRAIMDGATGSKAPCCSHARERLYDLTNEQIFDAFNRAIGCERDGVQNALHYHLYNGPEELRPSAVAFLTDRTPSTYTSAQRVQNSQARERTALDPFTLLAIGGVASFLGYEAANPQVAALVGVGVLVSSLRGNRALHCHRVAQQGLEVEMANAYDCVAQGTINPIDATLYTLFFPNLGEPDDATMRRSNAWLIARALRVLGVSRLDIEEAFGYVTNMPVHLTHPMKLLRETLSASTATEDYSPLCAPDYLIDLYRSPGSLKDPKKAAFKEFLEAMNYVHFASVIWNTRNVRHRFAEELMKL